MAAQEEFYRLEEILYESLAIAKRLQQPHRRNPMEHELLRQNLLELYSLNQRLSEAPAGSGVMPSASSSSAPAEAGAGAPAAAPAEAPVGGNEPYPRQQAVAPQASAGQESGPAGADQASEAEPTPHPQPTTDPTSGVNTSYHQPENAFLGADESGDAPQSPSEAAGPGRLPEQTAEPAAREEAGATPQAEPEGSPEPSGEAASETSETEPGDSETESTQEDERSKVDSEARKKAKKKKAIKKAKEKEKQKASASSVFPGKKTRSAPTAPGQDFVERLSKAEPQPTESPQPLHQRFVRDRSSLNEKASSDQHEPALAEKLQNRSVSDLHKAIVLNEKIRFVQELFKGEAQVYRQTIQQLQELDSWEEAQALLDQQLAERYGWNFDSETVQLFRGLVKRKFAH